MRSLSHFSEALRGLPLRSLRACKILEALEKEMRQIAGGGAAFEFVPQDEADVEYRVIFIFEDDVVSQYRAGILPGVAFTEGCT